MRENITVQQAINKGKQKLVYLPLLLFLASIGLGCYLQFMHYFEGWIIAISIFLGFVLAWFAWSKFVVEWKIWAYENVRNVHELKRKAIQNNLIWKDDSWFNKTEIISYDQKQKLKLLERKFLEKDVYHDDITVPKETLVHYSKPTIIFGFIFGGASAVFGIYCFLENTSEYFYLIFVGLGIFFLYQSTVKIIKNQPQILINSMGIQLYKSKLMEWKFIDNDFVEIRRRGKHVSHYLVFNYKNEHQEVSIDELQINLNKLENLLQVYRVRFEKNSL